MLKAARLATCVLACIQTQVAGDDPDLALIRSAQHANIGRFPQGELKATFRIGQTAPVEKHDVHHCLVVWSGDRIWTSVESWVDHRHSEIDTSMPPARTGQWIVDRGRSYVYSPVAQRVTITPASGMEPPTEAKLSPTLSWFSPLGSPERTWHWYLTLNERIGPGGPRVIFETSRPRGDQVAVLISSLGHPPTARMVFSLPDDGNLVKYEGTYPESGLIESCECRWARDTSGAVYLKQNEITIDSKKPGREGTIYKKLEVTHFNPRHSVSADRFSLSSLKLPPGTVIDDQITGRTSRVGDRPTQSVLGQLDSLIGEMQSRGFASRK